MQSAQGVPLLGHPSFWVEITASPYTETETKSRIFRTVSVKIQLISAGWWSDVMGDVDMRMIMIGRRFCELMCVIENDL